MKLDNKLVELQKVRRANFNSLEQTINNLQANVNYLISEGFEPSGSLIKTTSKYGYNVFIQAMTKLNTTMRTADSWHTELREERREPKDLSKRPHQFFAGLHERAILPEATGRCKRLD